MPDPLCQSLGYTRGQSRGSAIYYNSMPRKNLLLFGGVIGAIIAADFAKYSFLGFPALVNWESFAHPAWVIGTLILFFIGLKLARPAFWKLLLGAHTIVAAAALANHYFPFSETLTYNCMLFNFAFVSLYFAILQTRE